MRDDMKISKLSLKYDEIKHNSDIPLEEAWLMREELPIPIFLPSLIHIILQ